MSRETEGDFPIVYGPQIGVGHYCEIEGLGSDRVGEIGVVVPEGGYTHTETCVVNRGVHGGGRAGRVGTGGNRGPRIGRVGRAVRAAAAVDVVRGVGVHAFGGRETGLGEDARSPCSVIPGGGRGGGVGR